MIEEQIVIRQMTMANNQDRTGDDGRADRAMTVLSDSQLCWLNNSGCTASATVS